MVITQQPEPLSFAGNLKDFVITSQADIHFTLNLDADIVVDEIYTPADGEVRIRLRDVVSRYLSVTVPAYTEAEHEQVNAVKVFRAVVGDTSVPFTVIKGGIDSPGSVPDFLKYNFLTWQPQEKQICRRQPEFLSYYARESCNLKIKAYFKNGDSATYTSPVPAGKLFCFNLNYDIVNSFFDNEAGCTYYDVWVEDASGNRFTYVQRYIPVPEPDHAEIYVFENTLGGVDSFLCTGKLTEKISTEGVIATRYEETADDSVDLKVCYEQNTGYLRSRGEAEWLRDFFVSAQRYHVASEGLRKIYIEEQENKYTESDVNNYSFEYYYCKQTVYNKVVRNRDALPGLLEFPSAEGLFFLTPRLTEYPAAAYSDELLFPVQHPYTGEWFRLPASLLKPAGGSGMTVELVDNLTSARTDAGLTANMGRYLKSLIDGKASDWASITGKPETFPAAVHRHPWTDITGKPDTFPAAAHQHSAGDVNSGVFDVVRIPDIPVSKVTDLQPLLDLKLDKSVWDRCFYEKDGKVYCRLDFVGEKGVSAYGSGPDGSSGGGWDLINNLTSVRTDAGLTANMGRYLKSLIDEKASDWNSITGKPETFPALAHVHSWDDVTGKPSFDSLYVKQTGDTMTGHLNFADGRCVVIKNQTTGNASGIFWRNQAGTAFLGGMGMHTAGDVINSLYMGWGGSPWLESYNFSVSVDKIKYKGYNIWHAGNSNVAGVDWHAKDVIANGYLRSVFNGNTVQIGSVNTSFCHFINSAAIPFYFNRSVYVDGNIYGGTGRYDRRLAYVDEVHILAGNGEYDFLSKSSGCVQTIRVDGDKDTYYPVTIKMNDSGNYIRNIITITKWLYQASGAWAGNHGSHPNEGASGIYRYEYRNMWWDGNGGYIRTLHAWRGYAPFVAHTDGLSNGVGSLCIWLRGGGADYSLVANNPCTWDVYYSEINLGSSQYSVVVSPRTTVGNEGVYNNIITPIIANQIPGRTLWGQYFNGTANVSGSLTGVTDLTATGTVRAAVVRGGNLIIHAGNEFNSATGGAMAIGYQSTAYVSVGASCKTIIGAYREPHYALDVAGDIIADGWIRNWGQAGWYNETYGGGIYMTETSYVRVYNSKNFYVSSTDQYSVLTDGGFTRTGYGGSSWGNGHGALNVSITNNTAQTPLIVAYRYGYSPVTTGINRLFSAEFLNNASQLWFLFGGNEKFKFTSSGNFTATGEITAYSASDLRLKTNIRPLDGLAYIDNLQPVEFDWTNEARKLSGDNRQHGHGLIAQEVQNVLPDVVGNIYNSKYLGIRYEKLIPILIAAVKQLSDEVKQLKRA